MICYRVYFIFGRSILQYVDVLSVSESSIELLPRDSEFMNHFGEIFTLGILSLQMGSM